MSNLKAVFSYAMTMMEEERTVGSTVATCMSDKRTNTKSSNGGVFEEANVVHYAMHELGLCWDFR